MTRKQKPIPVRVVHGEPIRSSYREPDRHHVSMRQIENGWLINEHGYKNGKHFDREMFTPHQPSFATDKPSHNPSRANRLRNTKI